MASANWGPVIGNAGREMERSDAVIEARFREWDRQIARLQERCLAASGGEVERLRAALAQLAGARERAWSRWEVARGGGMWVRTEDVQRFQDAMRMAAEASARVGELGPAQGTPRAA